MILLPGERTKMSAHEHHHTSITVRFSGSSDSQSTLDGPPGAEHRKGCKVFEGFHFKHTNSSSSPPLRLRTHILNIP